MYWMYDRGYLVHKIWGYCEYDIQLSLETVKVFGVRITGQTGYTPAIAKTHDEIRSWLDAKVVEQNQRLDRS